jgi:hypothetical protein
VIPQHVAVDVPDATFAFCCLPKVQIQLKVKIVNRNDKTGCSNLYEPVVVLSNVGLHGSSRLLRTEGTHVSQHHALLYFDFGVPCTTHTSKRSAHSRAVAHVSEAYYPPTQHWCPPVNDVTLLQQPRCADTPELHNALSTYVAVRRSFWDVLCPDSLSRVWRCVCVGTCCHLLSSLDYTWRWCLGSLIS